MSSSSRRKQEDQNLKVLKSLQQLDCNKRCFECDQRGPTYVDVTIGSFVCTSCGGILRGINPPHRVKSVSMATFTSAEIALIQKRGNDHCAKVFLGKYDERSKAKPESRSDISKLRMFMEEKYEKKRWYVSPEEVEKNTAKEAAKHEPPKPSPVMVSGRRSPNLTLGKKIEPATVVQKPTSVDNILDDFATFDINQPASNATSNGSSFAFADFSSAFSQPAAAVSAPNAAKASPFDAFADFSSEAANIPPTVQPSPVPAAFQASFNQLNAASSATPAPVAPSTKTDKYADLGNLFSMDSNEPATGDSSNTLWGSVFLTNPASNSQPSNNSASVFGEGSVFASQGATTTSASQPFSSNMQPAKPQQPLDNFNMTLGQQQPTQNSMFPGNNSAQQQMFAPNNATQQSGFPYMSTAQNQSGFGAASQPQMLPTAATGGVNVFPMQPPPYTAPTQQVAAQNSPRQQQSASPYLNMTANQATVPPPQQHPAPVSNPFFQTPQQQPAASNVPASSNPFMTSSQPNANAWQPKQATGATPLPNNHVSATNPFMSNQAPPASMPTMHSSTNPFF